jgi:hypothetical protein
MKSGMEEGAPDMPGLLAVAAARIGGLVAAPDAGTGRPERASFRVASARLAQTTRRPRGASQPLNVVRTRSTPQRAQRVK